MIAQEDSAGSPGGPSFFDTENRRDARMLQRRKHTCLAVEPHPAVRIVRDGRRKEFDRHVAPELDIVRAIHFTHPAAADQAVDPIGADLRAGFRHAGTIERNSRSD